MAYKFSVKKFKDLSNVELYYILQARAQTFIMEPKKPFYDMDEIDFDSLHVMAHKNGELIGYTRIVPPIIRDDEPEALELKDPIVIDRTLMLADNRGFGVGQEMLEYAVEYCRDNFPMRKIKATVPPKLAPFYAPLGFKNVTSDPDAKKIDMVLSPFKLPSAPKSGLSGGVGIILIILGLLLITAITYLMPS